MRLDFNNCLSEIGEIGFVERVVSSLVYIEGLPGVKPQELVIFETGEFGLVTAISESSSEILSFSHIPVRVGSRVARTNKLLEIPIGGDLLGKTISPLGKSIDPSRPLPPAKETRPIDIAPQGIGSRAKISKACETGVSMVDLMIPLGKGQRELVMGDQKTGKSKFLLRSLLSQIKNGAVGVYAVIGKNQLAIKQIEEELTKMGILSNVVLIVSSADDATGMIYLTPYAAMTIAEYFRDNGRDVLIVLDDLSMHAKEYGEISLLGKRFPGRNSYPGDIFYTHSRLLERAGNFRTSHGELAITCLPVVETVQGDLTGYIQTNIMSMTDGHIFFDHDLFVEGRRPAIDPFLSVTRVGRQTQTPLQKEIGRALISFLRNVARMHNFASFGAELGDHIKRALEKEVRVFQFFDQTAYDRVPQALQLFLFGLIWGDAWRDKSRSELRILIQKILFMYDSKQEVRERIDGHISGITRLDDLVKALQDINISSELGV